MGISEILLIMAIALILFGPEDLPDIARKIGKIVFEIRKATNELTREFQSSINTPSNIEKKSFEQTTSSQIADKELRVPQSGGEEEKRFSTAEDLLTYEDEISDTQESSKSKLDDPLAELPLDMVSYEEKGASR